MVQKYLWDVAFTSEFLERLVVELFGVERFYELVTSQVMSALEGKYTDEKMASMANDAVALGLEKVIIAINEHDILVIPGEGISDADFGRLTSMLPPDKKVGIISADNVRILRVT